VEHVMMDSPVMLPMSVKKMLVSLKQNAQPHLNVVQSQMAAQAMEP
jgi:hypothetical protein